MSDIATGEILAGVIDGAVEESHAKVPKAVPVKDDENDRQEAAFRWAPEDREHAQAEKIDRLEREAAAAMRDNEDNIEFLGQLVPVLLQQMTAGQLLIVDARNTLHVMLSCDSHLKETIPLSVLRSVAESRNSAKFLSLSCRHRYSNLPKLPLYSSTESTRRVKERLILFTRERTTMDPCTSLT